MFKTGSCWPRDRLMFTSPRSRQPLRVQGRSQTSLAPSAQVGLRDLQSKCSLEGSKTGQLGCEHDFVVCESPCDD